MSSNNAADASDGHIDRVKRPDKLITYLQMVAATQLRPGRPAPEPVRLHATRLPSDLRPVYDELATAWGWPAWDDWKSGFERAGRHYFLLLVDSMPAGLAKFIDHGNNGVQIDNFGLTAPYIGRGFGGEALTRVIESAWSLVESNGSHGFVWLHTCNWDHPYALQNYRSRGFEVVRVEPDAESAKRDYMLPSDICLRPRLDSNQRPAD